MFSNDQARIKANANRQAIEYYQAAQELLDLAKNDAEQYISENESGFITGQEFKRETNTWLNRLDNIIDDLSGKPDPLNLLSKAKELRKRLSQVVSRPVDDITYDMVHAGGNARESKRRFWSKISDLFQGILSEGPDIIHAKVPSAEPDVIINQRTGHLDSVVGNAAQRPQQRLSTIPQAAPRQQMRLDQQGQARRRELKPVVTPIHQTVTHTNLDKENEQGQETTELDNKLGQQVEQEQAVTVKPTTITKQKVDYSPILKAASEAASELAKTEINKGQILSARIQAVEIDASNLEGAILDIIEAISEFDRTGDITKNIAIHGTITNLFKDFEKELGDKGDLLSLINQKSSWKLFLKRLIADSDSTKTLSQVAGEINAAINAISSEDDLVKKRTHYDPKVIHNIYDNLHEILPTLIRLSLNIKSISQGGNLSQLVSMYENKIAENYEKIATEITDRKTTISAIYLENKMYPENGSHDDFIKSVKNLYNRLNGTKFKSFVIATKSKTSAASQQQLSSIINMIERQIEEPAENNDTRDIGKNAAVIYSQLDKYSHILEEDTLTERASASINKLKNSLLKVIRNAANALEPEFKGDIIRTSRMAVQDLEIAVENKKHLDAVVGNTPQQRVQRQTGIPSANPRLQMRMSDINSKLKPVARQNVSKPVIAETVKPKENNAVDDKEQDILMRASRIALDVMENIQAETNLPEYTPSAARSTLEKSRSDIIKSKMIIDNNYMKFMKLRIKLSPDEESDRASEYSTLRDLVLNGIEDIISEVQKMVHFLNNMPKDVLMMDDGQQYDYKLIALMESLNQSYIELTKYVDYFNDANNIDSMPKATSWKKQFDNSVSEVLDVIHTVSILVDELAGIYKEYASDLRKFSQDILKPGTDYYNKFKKDYLEDVDSDADIFQAVMDILNDESEFKSIKASRNEKRNSYRFIQRANRKKSFI